MGELGRKLNILNDDIVRENGNAIDARRERKKLVEYPCMRKSSEN